MQTNTLLTLHNIHFSQNGNALLSGIDFSVAKGQIIGLLGVNGAGKSTTLKIAAGILLPTNGTVYYGNGSANTKATPNNKTEKCRIGYLPEHPPLIEAWTVGHFLRHVCTLHKLPKQHWQTAIERVTEQCSLQSILQQSISTLSKGNRQRVALAQAVIHRPDLLILDEPTSGLDPRQISQFRELILNLKPDTAIILSSHIMQEITALCDTTFIIHEGKQLGELSLSGHQQQLFIEFAQPLSQDTFTGIPAWQSGDGRQHQFSVTCQDEQNALLAACVAKHLPIVRIAGVEQLLESEFLSLIAQTDTTAHSAQVSHHV